MRFFLCNFGVMDLAFPEESIEALMVYTGGAPGTVERLPGETRFSLPGFLGMPEQEIRNGIILKENGAGERQVLLVTRVERVEDIPGGEIQAMPGITRYMPGVSFVRGIRFPVAGAADDGSRNRPLLFIDPALLVNCIKMLAE
jgi:hypothetical protein